LLWLLRLPDTRSLCSSARRQSYPGIWVTRSIRRRGQPASR
jgi:hypothetical protein